MKSDRRGDELNPVQRPSSARRGISGGAPSTPRGGAVSPRFLGLFAAASVLSAGAIVWTILSRPAWIPAEKRSGDPAPSSSRETRDTSEGVPAERSLLDQITA